MGVVKDAGQKIKVHGTVISKSRIRDDGEGNKHVLVASWIPLAHYQFIMNYADPDLGKMWESHMLRRIIREWKEEMTKRMGEGGKAAPPEPPSSRH